MEIRQGYKQTEVGIIPKEWEVKKLGDCFEFLTTNSYSREKMTYEEQEYMNIHYGDIHMKYGATLDIEKMRGKIPYIKSEETLPKKIILIEEGDLLIADASEDYKDIGKSSEVLNIKNNKVLGGLHTLLLRDRNNYFINGYKGYILRNEKISKKIKRIATGISVLGISKTNLSELNILIPPLKEQEKIAEILLNYDKAIEQQELLIEKEKEFKKGMMQKIFSQELRFKGDDGKDYPEWEEKRLQEIFTEKIERNIEKKELELLSVSINDGVQKRSEIEAKDNSSEDKSKYKIVRKDNIVYNTMRMWQGALGVSQYCGIVSPAYTVISLKVGGDINYFKYLFKTSNMIFLFKKFSQGLTSDTWNLKFEKFKEIKVLLPSSLEEQNKIVELLSLIDSKIEFLEKKLELLKKEKKGIMQKLLTGEVRV